jgi:hypothetical protein
MIKNALKVSFILPVLFVSVIKVSYAHDGVDHWEETYSPQEHCEFLVNKFSAPSKEELKDSILELKTQEVNLERIMLLEKVMDVKDLHADLPPTPEDQKDYQKAFLNSLNKVEEDSLRTKLNIADFKTTSENSMDLLGCIYENSDNSTVLKMKEGLKELTSVDIEDENSEEKGQRLKDLTYAQLRDSLEKISGVKSEGDKKGMIIISFDKDVVFVGLYKRKANIKIQIDDKRENVKVLKPWWAFATDMNIWELSSKIPDAVKGNNFADTESWRLVDFLKTKDEFIKTFQDEIKKAMAVNSR